MVKMFAFPSRRADVTVADFHAHWRGPHRELAERIPSFRRYVQSHRRWDLDPGLPSAPFEGSAEVWFDRVGAALGMQDDPAYAEGAAKDEPNFIDMERLVFIFTAEDVNHVQAIERFIMSQINDAHSPLAKLPPQQIRPHPQFARQRRHSGIGALL